MAQFLYPPPPALPRACFRCSPIAASMSEFVVLGLHLFKASEGREYEYKNQKNQKARFEQEKRIFTNFHRQLFCWIDKWVELNMEDIRRMEEETQKELEELRKQGQVQGTTAADE
ncbi:phosphatidylinositol transfer protein beta isoform-like isoform X2 [Onychostoma macrolepis]|uniref:phosphatidylinositol transfer protein beta isoform-like isoform X2 n=1 Tax=Onychostoma macrolepis TaxID=369639 RepID=UPI00272A1CA1|nr:phosphatidylinositol transfer protein beta isoform-like isoform X2 [Onychostoma macrolepis]